MTAQLSLNTDPGPTFDGLITDGDAKAFAVFSPCRTFRYLLGRTWDPRRPAFVVTMCNPSIADALVLDPTVTRIVGFAKREGCGSILVANLAAYRSTDPKGLREPADIVGPRNLELIQWALLRTPDAINVAAWGRIEPKVRARLEGSVEVVRRFASIAPVHCLGWTLKSPMEPRHPLYLSSNARLKVWK